MKKLFVIFLFMITFFRAVADEGMWIPILLSQGPEAEMKRLGMKISADDIFNLNKPSMKDAICLFGGGCTAELVSDKGLILTNHHCGYSAIQAHSSVEQDYLTNGFWASSFEEELPNPKLTVSILTYMEDVTEIVLKDISDGMTAEKRNALIALHIETLVKEKAKDASYEVTVESFYYGNQYILIISRIFKDVRLVGAPPSGIGKFGGDTDNWMWPRHTGDFSVFRIYADKDNNPATYSRDNIPYKPPYYLPISLKGVKPDDFTFVFGYPGTTNEYLVSYAVDRIVNYENPITINIRQKKLDVIRKYMEAGKKTRIQYSSKYFGIENYYKKMIGENKGVKRTNIIAEKQKLEEQFANWAQQTDDRKNKYGLLMTRFRDLYEKYGTSNLALEYFFEAGLGVEIVRYASSFEQLVKLSNNKKQNDSEINNYIDRLKNYSDGFFKNYDSRIDHELAGILLGIYYHGLDKTMIPDEIVKAGTKYNGDLKKYADELFKKSFLTDAENVAEFLNHYQPSKTKEIEKDPIYVLSKSIYNFYRNNLRSINDEFQMQAGELYRIYMQGLMEMLPEKKFYPDANSTLRVAYGKVSGFVPRDGVEYNYYTKLTGVMEKEDSTVYDYKVDDKLKNLYRNNDYGIYGDKDGTMHVAFIATNHTTGGNSGSPVLNAEGHLIGINFDRVWEGTMSDIVFEEKMCRNISLDIRYCLFIIDKYAGAQRLIDEMTLVK
ncbi:MAG TPA: S46 family peptidase [Bacteroidales bacterium]|nr:S46 family peptidase [Bacteroidales bacterium]